mmetsp:Transcript_11440/g.23912  ORF Transcript_11440/g.23912 Transcript_11440/m.23912 type:complete len:217 (-) Transcript_11440:773-1423(-)
MISFFGGRPFSTSFFSRRSKKGRSTLWSCCTTSCWSLSPSILNQSSNCSLSWKSSGTRKLSSAHSSCRLFCRGVPVMSSRLLHFSVRSTTLSREFSFLMRCASSMMMYRQWNFLRRAFSVMIISKEVTQMSHLPGTISSSRMRRRSSLLPWNLNARSDGHQRRISLHQLPSVDLGTATRCGPEMPRYSCRYPSSEMVWSVFPRPISSARMPLTPFS